MITLNLDEHLENKLKKFARENNIQVEVLIETVLYDYADTIDLKEELNDDNLDGYTDADIEMVKKSLGL